MSVRDFVILGSSGQQPTRKRNQGGYLLRWHDIGILIDPGEGIQRQFIFAKVPPTCVTHILISHFHGDHCLGVGSMLMRLNLDGVQHVIKCYYPCSGESYFQSLRYGTIYHEKITIIGCPLNLHGGYIDLEDCFIEYKPLDHGPDTFGWRIQEKDHIRFDKNKIQSYKLDSNHMKDLITYQKCQVGEKTLYKNELTYTVPGASIASILDTRPCKSAEYLAHGVNILLCDSTFGSEEKKLARQYKHMTSIEAAKLAKFAGVDKLVLTHFSSRYTHEEDLVSEAKKIFPNVVAAKDLMRIDVPKNPGIYS